MAAGASSPCARQYQHNAEAAICQGSGSPSARSPLHQKCSSGGARLRSRARRWKRESLVQKLAWVTPHVPWTTTSGIMVASVEGASRDLDYFTLTLLGGL